ncbi:MAG TPA: amidase [Candidimonas sp.]|nr:amidase [Candidimonas sp.]
MHSLVELNAVELASAIRSRNVSCLEVMGAYLAHIDRLNPQVNALVAMRDHGILLDEASALDRSLDKGQAPGLLYGLPQAPKDILPVAGMVTTKGSPIFKDTVPNEDAISFARMRDAGALFIGRSNSPEFGLGGHTYNPVYGITRNAFRPQLSAGGSSGGAGSAVALHLLPMADGSDMMGSLRTPAAFNNVFGLRTTPGLVPHGAAIQNAHPEFSVSGPMARNIPDLSLLLSVMAGKNILQEGQPQPLTLATYQQELQQDFSQTRIGWLGDLGGHLPMEQGVIPLCEAALTHFTALGAKTEALTPDFDFNALWRAWIDLRSLTVATANKDLYDNPATRALLKPEAVWEIERGLGLDKASIDKARQTQQAWKETVQTLFTTYDYLILPSAQVFPFAAETHWPDRIGNQSMDTYHRWMQAVIPATMAGLPTLAAPAGFSPEGYPMGIQIMAAPWRESALLRLGHAYDQASGYARIASPLLA